MWSGFAPCSCVSRPISAALPPERAARRYHQSQRLPMTSLRCSLDLHERWPSPSPSSSLQPPLATTVNSIVQSDSLRTVAFQEPNWRHKYTNGACKEQLYSRLVHLSSLLQTGLIAASDLNGSTLVVWIHFWTRPVDGRSVLQIRRNHVDLRRRKEHVFDRGSRRLTLHSFFTENRDFLRVLALHLPRYRVFSLPHASLSVITGSLRVLLIILNPLCCNSLQRYNLRSHCPRGGAVIILQCHGIP